MPTRVRIVVDGVSYRGSGRSRPTSSRVIACGTMTFAVVNEGSPGTTLDVMRPDDWLHARALVAGWRSKANGSPHRLAMSVADQAFG